MVSRHYIMRRHCSKHLSEDFRRNIQFTRLVSEKPFMGVLATNDDQVYAFGADENNYFGLGPVSEIPKLTKIDSLCGKKIRQFASNARSGCHILALSERGIAYAWGSNSHGELGDGSKTNKTVPIFVAGDLEGKIVKEVHCTSGLSVAVTANGKVFTWGCNSIGRTGHGTDSGNTLTPKVVEGLLGDQNIVKICSNIGSLFCLSREGKVFTFGYNAYGNLGIGNTANELSPVLTMIPDGLVIRDVSSGSGHTLALTEKGVVLTWGYNSNGQLGIGSTANNSLPTRIKFNVERRDSDPTSECEVSKILAEGETSFAMDTEGTVYVWGLVHGEKVLRPNVSEMGLPQPSALTPPSPPQSVVSDLLKSFDNEATSDFVISVEGKNVYVHKAVLQIRSSYFATMFNNDWKETERHTLVIEHHSYALYREFLRYVYCGDVQDLPPEQNIRLLDLASMVLDDRLVDLCSERIKEQVNVENLLEIFSLALTFKKEELVDYCARWAVDKGMKSVLESDAFKVIPPEHVREFILRGLGNGGFN